MRLLVIGAHRGVGAQIVSLARSRDSKVETFEGDVLDAKRVLQLVAGNDAVVSTLGPRHESEPDLCSRGTRHIVEAMQRHSVPRLVQMSGAMVGHPHDRLGGVYRLIRSLVPSSQLEDRRLAESIVRESGLDWTILRPTRLTDEPGRGTWRSGHDETVGAFARIARADVALAAVRALADNATVGRAFTLQY